MTKIRSVANTILLWASILGIIASGAIAFVRTKDAVEKVPALEARVSEIESYRKRDDERWKRLFQWTDKIERRLNRRQ